MNCVSGYANLRISVICDELPIKIWASGSFGYGSRGFGCIHQPFDVFDVDVLAELIQFRQHPRRRDLVVFDIRHRLADIAIQLGVVSKHCPSHFAQGPKGHHGGGVLNGLGQVIRVDGRVFTNDGLVRSRSAIRSGEDATGQ